MPGKVRPGDVKNALTAIDYFSPGSQSEKTTGLRWGFVGQVGVTTSARPDVSLSQSVRWHAPGPVNYLYSFDIATIFPRYEIHAELLSRARGYVRLGYYPKYSVTANTR